MKRFDLSKVMKFSLNSRNDTELETNSKIKNSRDFKTLRKVTRLELI